MKKTAQDIFKGFVSLLTGMGITLRQFFKPVITEQYPHTTPQLPTRFRGHIELVRDKDTGMSTCIACLACQKACPSDCIVVNGIKKEGEKKKSVTEYLMDFNKCSLCGACIEVCPTDALQFSQTYNLAGTDKNQFHMDLMKRLQQQNSRDAKLLPAQTAAAVPVPAASEAPAPAATVPPTQQEPLK
ncbi:MAG: NADH-quinone oxidoreductase subunit I [Verrucomicrobiota bacterium]|nr:NADH-quinone oxidoreductase subunit I [Verrucomicrobiota bacterium]